MNFIQLCRETWKRVHGQGTGPTSVSTTGYDQAVVTAVQDSWLDIQNRRINWKWMRATQSFLLVVGQTEYTLADIFGPTNRYRYWLRDTCYVLDNGKYSQVRFVDYDVFIERHLNDTTNTKISEFTIRPWDDALIFNSPDNTYTIKIDYQKSPQELTIETDIPELQDYRHNVILYGAIERYAAEINQVNVLDYYSRQFSMTMADLMREELPQLKQKKRPVI